MDNVSREGFTKRVYKRLFFLTGVITIVSAILSAGFALNQFNQTLRPVIQAKVATIGDQIESDFSLASEAGIPFMLIPGIDSYLEQVRINSPEVVCIGVFSTGTNAVYSSGDSCKAKDQIIQQAENSGIWSVLFEKFGLNQSQGNVSDVRFDYFEEPIQLRIGLDPTYVQDQLTDVFFDLLILLVVVLLVSFEVILVLLMYYVTHPIEKLDEVLSKQAAGDFSTKEVPNTSDEINHLTWSMNNHAENLQKNTKSLYEKIENEEKEKPASTLLSQLKNLISKHNLFAKSTIEKEPGAIVDVRIPLFIFVFAEELQKSFMPLFVAENYTELPYLSAEVAIGLPISVFMLVIAIITPFGGALADKFGNKMIFLLGLGPAILGYLACAFTDNFITILAARALTATGYAVIVISSQGYIASAASKGNRVKGMAVFIGVVMSGSMCGTAIGGILADRLGFNNVFFVAAVFAFIAGVLALQMMKATTPNNTKAKKSAVKESKWSVFKNTEFVSIVVFSAIPAKIILTGFLYYLVPVALSELGSSVAEIGRIMMLYPLLIIPLSPVIARYVDKHNASKAAVIIGSICSGAALILMNSFFSIAGILATVVLVSISHASMKAALIATALEAADKSDAIGNTTALGILRTSERIGSVIGPILVALLLSSLSVASTMLVVGLIVAGAAMLLAVIMRSSKTELPISDQGATS
jgi:predicted MFS family arabinose efflux permease/HAMP domain-containing protein